MKNILSLLVFIVCSSWNPRPHLLVGQWSITEDAKVPLNSRNRFISRIYFGSNEHSAVIDLCNRKGRDQEQVHFEWNVVEHEQQRLLAFRGVDGRNLVYLIERLGKDSLFLRMQPDQSAEDFFPAGQSLKFERIAGPPENMP